MNAQRPRRSAGEPSDFAGVEVLRPKELETHPGDSIVGWARAQLEIARSILDNPGGGLLFATQTIGQVRAGLHERDSARWEAVEKILEPAEGAAVRREFAEARTLLDQAIGALKP
ncbi:MAG TPA: hypothetical protein VGG90_00120 [Candidatus Dormibacteraeota bacterium]